MKVVKNTHKLEELQLCKVVESNLDIKSIIAYILYAVVVLLTPKSLN